MTMMVKQWKPADSNLVLENTCDKGGVFAPLYERLKKEEISEFGSGEVQFQESVKFRGEELPVYFIALEKSIKFDGMTKNYM